MNPNICRRLAGPAGKPFGVNGAHILPVGDLVPHIGGKPTPGGGIEKAMKAYLLFVLPLSVVSVVSLSRTALAQDAPPDAPPAIQVARPEQPPAPVEPKMDLSTAPVAPAVQRTYHFHEGFYLRTSVGFGWYSASYSDGHRPNSDFNDHGASMSLDLLIGGSPSPGVSIGGGLLLDPLFGSKYERNGVGQGSHGGYSTLIGPFIDGFPDVTRGWHLGGMIGFAGQSFQNVNANDSHSAAGIGGAAWFGYDFWVANEWSIGPQMRVLGMRTSDTKSGEDVSAFARSITFGMSAVFN